LPTLIDLRRRIQSVRNSQKVTAAMKTVATARYKKAHRLVVERRPFWHTFPELAVALSRQARASLHPFLESRPEKRILVLVVTSDKGLCGAFNSNLLEAVSRWLEQRKEKSSLKVIPVGKKAVNYFRKTGWLFEKNYSEKIERKTREISEELSQYLSYQFLLHQVDAVYVAYNEFRSIIAPRITIRLLLPIVEEKPENHPESASFFLQPDWEPEAREIIDYLLRFYLKHQLQHFLLESQAAEQASRMMAMENATRNAGELISELVLLLNKIRQASITKELLEIQTAVEALRQQGV